MTNEHIDREVVKTLDEQTRADLNADPITGEPGAHPVGTGLGAVGGVAAGAAVGALGGPLGMLIGAAIGAFAGGKAGSAAGELLNPTEEEAYWRTHYTGSPYYRTGYDFDRDYHSAYAAGYANRHRYGHDVEFDSIEPEIHQSWEEIRGESRLTWDEAREAARDAWNRNRKA